MNIANEPRLGPWTKMRVVSFREHAASGQRGTEWLNPEYCAIAYRGRRPLLGIGPVTDGVVIEVIRRDHASVVDWRDLQEIKNDIAGREAFAVEVFPPESLLVDPSNMRILWAWESKLPFGLPCGRRVLDSDRAIAPQRPLRPSVPEASENERKREQTGVQR